MSETDVIYGVGEVTVITVSEQGPPGAPGADGADVAYVDAGDTAARARVNHTGTQLAATISDFPTAADARVALQKGAANGLAPLGSDGKLASSFLPALAITDTFPVVSQAAMLALTAEVGDIAVRTDLNKSFILRVAGASTLGNWQELLTPTDAVLSVNGQTGAVSLSASGLGALATSANLSDLANASAARTNLGVAIGTDVQAHNASLTALGALGATGLMTQTSDGVYVSRSIAAGSASVTVTNGNGVSGNPTIDLAPATTGLIGGVQLAGDLSGTAVNPRVVGLQRVFNVKDYGATGDGVTNDRTAINLAIAAANLVMGTVYFPRGTYYITSKLTSPVTGTTWCGDGQGVSTIKGAGTFDYAIYSTSTLNHFQLSDLTFDVDNVDHGSGVLLHNISNSLIKRVEFKNGANHGWLLIIGVNTPATDAVLNFNNKVIDCDFDTHVGSLEMFLLFNSQNTQIIRPRFSNKTSGPALGLWQKCYGTTIVDPQLLNIGGAGIYYSVTVEDTLIDGLYAKDAGAPITGANTSDWGNFGLTQAQNLKIVNPILIAGTYPGNVGIQLGAVNNASVINPHIEGYTIGIRLNTGNNSNTAAPTNWQIRGGEIRNGNATNDVHLLHPAIMLSGAGGSQYGLIQGVRIYDDQVSQTQRYPIVFDGAYTWNEISIVENRLSADTGSAGVSVKLADGAALGANVYIANNRDYSGTNPAQVAVANDSLLVHLAGSETITGAKLFTATTTQIGNGGGDSRSVLNLGGDMHLGPNFGHPTVRSLFAAKSFRFNSNAGSTTASVALDTGIITGAGFVGAITDGGGQFFNVKSYGAIGDGTTDDTVAVQAAFTAANAAGGGTVFFPLGTYVLSSILISSKTIALGAGIGSVLKLKNTTNGFMFTTRDTAASPTSYPHDHQFRDLYFDLNMANNTTSAGAIKSEKNRNAIVERCSFVNFKGNCVYFSGGVGNNVQPRFINNQFDFGDRTDGVGIKLDSGCYDSLIMSNDIGRAWRGIILSNGGDGNHSLVNNWTWANADCGIYLYQSHNVLLSNNTQDQNYGTTANGAGLCIDGCNNVAISSNKASNNSWRDTANIMGFGVIGTVNINSGIRVFGGSTNIRISNSIFSNPNGGQQYGIQAEASSLVYYNNCTFTDQQTGNTNAITSAVINQLDAYSPGGTDVPVADGGTGASTASAARSNLGLVIGTDVLAPAGNGSALTGITESQVSGLVSDLAAKQPLDSDLTTIAGLTATTDNFMVAASSVWASRTPAQAKTSLALVKADVGLGSVDNTADTAKPVSTAQQTALDLKVNLAGTSGGQTINGDTASAGTLTLHSTSHATKGKILWGNSAFDEANNRIGINTISPSVPLEVNGVINVSNSGSQKVQFGGIDTITRTSATGELTLTTNASDITLTPSGTVKITDAKNIAVGTTTGTKIGTASSQKLALWNATPIVQPTTAFAAATLVGGAGVALTDTDTFDGYTLKQIVKALRSIGLLA